MPELPEVETVVQRLKKLVSGKTINDLEVLRPKSYLGDPRDVRGAQISDVTRRAKLIRFHLPSGMNLLSHLKMTGQFIYVDDDIKVGGGHPTADWVSELPSSHTRVQIILYDGARLFFNDMRVFGWIRHLTDDEVEQEYKKYGPDIVDNSLTLEYLEEKLARTRRPIKQAIMDNKIMAGVGNIYASDALNLAQVNPAKPANELSTEELQKVLDYSKQVIQKGIETGGATIDNYKQVDGFSGSYQNFVQAYGREGETCFQCGGEIVKAKIGGRGTYYCRHCQS